MSSFYLNQASNGSAIEMDEDRGHLSPYTSPNCDPSSFPYPIFFKKPHDQEANDRDHLLRQLQQQEPKEPLQISGSSRRSVSHHTDKYGDCNTPKLSLCDQYVREEGTVHDQPNQWISSKMRFMRKMMSCDRVVFNISRRKLQVAQDQSKPNRVLSSTSNDSDSPSGILRVCSDCNTTKTPLWRSGPQGPKSLCNACGIRQRKARRAMEAATAVNGGLIPPSHAPTKARKEKNIAVDSSLPFKKRCKIATSALDSQKKLCFEDSTISLSANSAFNHVFPQDERDAAILLMALSYGLIRS